MTVTTKPTIRVGLARLLGILVIVVTTNLTATTVRLLCPSDSCECMAVITVNQQDLSTPLHFEVQCQNNGLTVHSHVSDTSSTRNFLIEATSLDSHEEIHSCTYDMSSVGPVSWSDWAWIDQCNGISTEVTRKRTCSIDCSKNQRQRTKAMRNLWYSNVVPATDGCPTEVVETLPCCVFSNLSPSVYLKWHYSDPISVSAYCANTELNAGVVSSQENVVCNSNQPQLLTTSFGKCTFALCDFPERLNDTLHADITIAPSELGFPALLVYCYPGSKLLSGATQQRAECNLDQNGAKAFNVDSLQPCIQDTRTVHNSDDSRSSQKISDNECVVIDQLQAYWSIGFKYSCPPGESSLQLTGQNMKELVGRLLPKLIDPINASNGKMEWSVWVGASPIAGDFLWNDGSSVPFDEIIGGRTEYYMDYDEGFRKHLALTWHGNHVNFTQHISEGPVESRIVKLHMACLNDKPETWAEGIWSSWSIWNPCYAGVSARHRICEKSFCAGCAGEAKEEKRCCKTGHSIIHGDVHFDSSMEMVILSCEAGYTFSNGSQSVFINCSIKSNWQQEFTECKITDSCEEPENGTNTIIVGETFLIGDVVTYTCKKNHVISGTFNTTLPSTCLSSEYGWSHKAPHCAKIMLLKTALEEKRTLDNEKSTLVYEFPIKNRPDGIIMHGDVVQLNCVSGYEFRFLQSTLNVTVQTSGIDDAPECKRNVCIPPPTPLANSRLVSGKQARSSGSTITYQCLPGFVDMSGIISATMTCQPNRTWHREKRFICQRRRCMDPSLMLGEHGSVINPKDSGYFYNDAIYIKCNDSYGIKKNDDYSSATQSFCNQHGHWSDGSALTCIPVRCSKIENLHKAEITGGSYDIGDNLILSCFPQHRFLGTLWEDAISEVILECQWDGTWKGPTPRQCYTKTMQYGAYYDADTPGKINLTWVNTDYKEGEPVFYTFYLIGHDEQGIVRVNITKTHSNTARKSGEYSTEVTVPPGFNYSLWVEAQTGDWKEIAHGKPHVQFYAPTGTPAFLPGYTLEDARPQIISRSMDMEKEVSVVEMEIFNVFSPTNGSVHTFNIIVAELNDFVPEPVLNGQLDENLTTWARARLFPLWPPYLITKKCQLFTGAGCPDLASKVSRNKRYFSAKNPVFLGDDAFLGSLDEATGLEDVAITDDNLNLWMEGRSGKDLVFTQYTIGAYTCDITKTDLFCNGKLKLTGNYCIKLRAHTNEHYIDSPCAMLTDDKASLLVKWHKTKVTYLSGAVLPLGLFSVIVVIVTMRTDFHEEEEQEVDKKRLEFRKQKTKGKWKTAIFDAYDVALTADNNRNVTLLAVASMESKLKLTKSPLAFTKKSPSKPIRKASFFDRHREWILMKQKEANERVMSFISLNELEDDELFIPENILMDQHIPYEMYQQGKLVKPVKPAQYEDI